MHGNQSDPTTTTGRPVTARPFKVFVQDVGPTWSFATRAAAEARAADAVGLMGYGEVLVWKAGEGGCWVHTPERPEGELLDTAMQRRLNAILGGTPEERGA